MPTFTVRPGIYLTPTGDPATATQRWHRDGVEIVGATGTSYTTASPADDGKLIEYVENVANLAGSAAEQRLTLQALAAPTGIITGTSAYTPRGTNSRSVSKITIAQRIFVNGQLGNFEAMLQNGSAFSLWNLNGIMQLQLGGVAAGATTLTAASVNGGFVSMLLSVDYTVSGDLGSGVIAKLKAKGASIDISDTILEPGGYTAGSKTLDQDYFSQVDDTAQLQSWSYYHEGAALDPATHWDSFFDASGMPKAITSAWPAGIMPSFYLPAVASSWTSNANDGADSSFGWVGPTITDV